MFHPVTEARSFGNGIHSHTGIALTAFVKSLDPVFGVMSKMRVSSNSTVVATNSQVSTAIGNETVILHFEKGTYFGLNEVGTAIWARLREPQKVSDLCGAILTEFNVDSARCEQDVLSLLDKLYRAGLIEVRSEPAA